MAGKPPVVIVGIGQLAGVFARGLLAIGHPLYPVTRDSDTATLAAEVPGPALTLVTVAEIDLDGVLERLPAPWHSNVGLVQNELLPDVWQRHQIDEPTVAVVWFEKKRGREVKVIIPTPVAGPQAGLLGDALEAIAIPTRRLTSDEELVFELAAKNLYILVANIAGLEAGGTVGSLWADHRPLVHRVAADVLAIQDARTDTHLPAEDLMQAVSVAVAADPEHVATGRTAPARLDRALADADRLGLAVPELRRIASRS